MKKKEYITPDMVIVNLQNLPLMQAISGFETQVNNDEGSSENDNNASGGLGKSGWNWSDEPEDVNF